jgi:hypothetical protein
VATIKSKKKRQTEEAQNLVPRILKPLIRLLKASGVSDTSISEAVDTACRLHGKERVRGVNLDFERYCALADVVMMWARDPEFIDDRGLPKRLNTDATEPSFQRLMDKSGVAVGIDEAVKSLRDLHSIQFCGNRRQIRLTSHVLLSVTPRHFVVGAVLDEIRRFLETIEHNVCENPDAIHGRLQRTVMCASLDPDRFPEAQRFVRLTAQTFLDALDEKLNACSVKQTTGQLRYGAGIYVFVDPERNLKKIKRRKRERS